MCILHKSAKKGKIKMSKTRRIIAGILAAAMMVPLAACGGGDNAVSGDVTKITLWRTNGHDKEFVQRKVKEFNDTIGKDEGIELEYVAKEGDLDQLIDVAYTSGQAPDLYATNQLEARAQKGQIVAYDDIAGTEEIIEKYGDKALESRHSYNGKIYMLPVTSCTYGLVYNKQMFVDAGIVDENGEAKPPVTLAELVEDAKLLTDASKQQYGIIFPGKWDGWYMTDINFVSSASTGIVDGYNPQTGKFDYEQQAYVMDAMLQIKRDGSCVPGTEGFDNDPARARFAQGNIGMKIAGSYDVGVFTTQFPAQIEWGVAPLPLIDENTKGMQYGSLDGLYAVNSESVERVGEDKIATVLNYFASDEYLIEQFKEGLSIPCDYELVKDVEVPDEMENWKTFASFTPFSQCPPVAVKTEMNGEKVMDKLWLDIWNEEPSLDELKVILQEYQDKVNAGIEVYQEEHPEYDPTPYIIKDWKLTR